MSDNYISKILSHEETLTLAKLHYYREMATIKRTPYTRPTNQLKDMKACNSAFMAATDLLSFEQNDKAFVDSKIEDVRQKIWESVRGGLRNGIENIRNMTLRQQYLADLKSNVLAFRTRLDQLDITNYDEIQELALQAAEARNLTLSNTRNSLSTTARAFSEYLKEEGLNFNQLRNRYVERAFKDKRIATNSWEAMTDQEIATVYEDIIKASGRANIIVNNLSKAMGVLGTATVILILGCIAWDIVEAENPTLSLVKDSISLGAGVVGGVIGTELGVLIGSSGGPLGVFLGGVIGGVIGGFLAGLAADSILDVMVKTFSQDTDQFNFELWGNPTVYQPILPNGRDLSRSLFPS